MSGTLPKTSKASQVAVAKKAAAMKAANAAKRPQPFYLRKQSLAERRGMPPATPERDGEAHRSQGPPRLLSKKEVLKIVGVTYVTLWKMMLRGEFPRPRCLGPVKNGWVSTEVDQWLATLPMRRLKGDPQEPDAPPADTTARRSHPASPKRASKAGA